MKTLTKNNRSLYLFEDTEYLNITSQNIIVGNPEILIISDCNSTNTVVHTDVTAPDDWVGCKYLYIDGVWLNDPTWREKPISVDAP